MNKINQKIIIFSFIFFLLLGFLWLSYNERKQTQINNQWFLYFKNPTDANLDFVIENYTNSQNFTWQLIDNNRVTKKENVIILKNEIKNVIINSQNDKKGILKIKVIHHNSTKEIYKKF